MTKAHCAERGKCQECDVQYGECDVQYGSRMRCCAIWKQNDRAERGAALTRHASRSPRRSLFAKRRGTDYKRLCGHVSAGYATSIVHLIRIQGHTQCGSTVDASLFRGGSKGGSFGPPIRRRRRGEKAVRF